MRLPISFKLVKIDTEQFASLGEVPPKGETQQLRVSYGFSVNNSLKRIRCQGKFLFTSGKTPFLTLQLSCEFEVNDWDILVDKKEKCIQLPVDLTQHLAVITTGTARGVFHTKTENSKFNRFFLPAINLKDILTETVSFALSETGS